MKYNIFNLLNDSREKNMDNKKKTKTFLVREIPAKRWQQFKIKSIKDGSTCNSKMLELIETYIGIR